ncbi:MAG TPA: HlyD family efflux transporter periplasmic adaptor subunit [Longimicrobiaceae bacterium]|nr:HlyD family efflux transporter periplasmic adaptor subunit [Longimicrobiaceae bacterium]
MYRILFHAGLLAALAGCGRGDEPDAYGNFETTEVVVSAETGGQLVRFDPVEGERLPAGTEVALIDTTALALQREEIASQREAVRSRTTEVEAQTGVLEAELATARREYERTRRLYADEAATRQQLDQAEGQVRVLVERIRATRAQGGTAGREVGSAEARLAQIEERIRDSRIVNPVAGTVLATYARTGEFVQPGQPLYRVGDLSRMVLRAYVTGDQLPAVRIGQRVRVTVDAGGSERRTLPGTVSRVSSEAEFTPTPIQTREERADLVYAVEVRVSNADGSLKIGMPGEVEFPEPARREG